MGTFIAAALVIIACVLAIRSIIRDRKRGISSCGVKCSDCSMHCGTGEIPERFKLKN